MASQDRRVATSQTGRREASRAESYRPIPSKTRDPPGAVEEDLPRREYLTMIDTRNTHPAPLMTNEGGAGEYIGFKPATLRAWRSRGLGPRYMVCGSRAVRYAYADLDQWLSEQAHVDPVAAA